MPRVPDRYDRPLRNLRLSVTDRCNLRCSYCMPEAEYVWLPKSDVLTYEEMHRIVRVFVGLGVDKVRLTGGEPLLRTDVETLVRMLAAEPEVRELAMTTNGVLLAERAVALREAGLDRLTISLDTLDADTFRLLSRRDDLARTLAGIDAARAAGFADLKLDTVVIAGVNDGELPRLLDYARGIGAEVRFIEYMDVGGATHWRADRVVSRATMLERLSASHGTIETIPRTDSAPAERFRLSDGTTFGIIASVTQPFCATCDRARVTADGMWFTCLYATQGTNLRDLLRSGASDEQLAAALRDCWTARNDRGAELRAATPDRKPLADAGDLRGNPHLEMHTRGG
ncbi:MAG: Cyclic pyranopterin monophosphate synthase 3 [Planctomycetota bacterium]